MGWTGRSVGRCKHCKTPARSDSNAWMVKCKKCGKPVKLQPVYGELSPGVKCGAKCRNAIGPACDCSCAGANHGMNN